MPTNSQLPPNLLLVIRHPVPSLNALFGMQHWQRVKEKKATQAAFLSALRALDAELSTQTICAGSTRWTASAIQEFCETIERQKSSSLQRKKRSLEKKKSAQK